MVVENVFLPGQEAAPHSHPHTQIVYVVEGRIEMNVAGETRKMGKGDSVYVKSNFEHSLTALEESKLLDIFTPMREDFLEK